MSLCKPMSVIYAFVFSIVLVGCDDNGKAEPTAQTPSPIASFDKDRLWLLMRFANNHIGPLMPVKLSKCGGYFNSPNDPRFAAMSKACEGWSLNMSEYLRINELPTILPEHLTSAVFWDWHASRYDPLLACQKERPRWPTKGWKEAAPCDEYERLWEDHKESKSSSPLAEILAIDVPTTLPFRETM